MSDATETNETKNVETHPENTENEEERVIDPSVKTLEEDEDALFKMRAKLFRFDKPTSQWKERGTGDVKLLQHKENKKIRLLMRREKTFKICANHYVHPLMKLEVNVGSDRSWMWSCPSDFAEEEPKEELFAIRFANSENAQKFKEKFEECQKLADSGLEATAVPPSDSKPEKKEEKAEEKTEEKVEEKKPEEKATESIPAEEKKTE